MDEWLERLARLEEEVASMKEEISRLRTRVPGSLPGVEELLTRRGLSFSREEKDHKLLLPAGERQMEHYYRLMCKYSFRIFLRDLISRTGGFSAGQRWKYCSPATVERYLNELTSLGMVRRVEGGMLRLVNREVDSFGETLEWFTAEVLKREFHLPSVRGLKPLGMDAGGDFDVLAVVGEALVYIEVKSSPPKHIELKEVTAFVRRLDQLSPKAAVFLVDTQLRMKDKVVPMLMETMAERARKPERLKEGVYLFPDRTYAISSKPSMIHNLRHCLGDLYKREVLL